MGAARVVMTGLSPGPMGEVQVRSYEELTGGFGHAVAFRARRQLARELLRQQVAAIAIAGVDFQLYDIAMSGVSFLAPADAPQWHVDDILEVDIRVHGTSAYRGRARVAREERVYGQRRVGLQLLSGFLDLHEMQRLDEEEALARDLRDGPERIHARLPLAYREALFAAQHFVAFYRRTLAYHEARLADGDTRADHDALALRAIGLIRPRWQALRLAVDRLRVLDQLLEGEVQTMSRTIRLARGDASHDVVVGDAQRPLLLVDQGPAHASRRLR